MKSLSCVKKYLISGMMLERFSTILLSYLLMSVVAPAYGQGTEGSHITSRTALSSDGSRMLEQRVYDNGLGDIIREVQSWPGSALPDIVVRHEYDDYRRRTKNWLPVTVSSGSGFVNATTIAFQAQSQYSDPAPFERTEYDGFLQTQPSEQYKAGTQWQTNGKKVSVTYSEYVGAGMYSPEDGLMYVTDNTAKFLCTRTVDEDGCWSAEYTDLNGRVMISETSQGKTYYMYNHWGDLTFVIPPMLSDYLISHYGYDSEMIEDTDNMMQKYAYIYRYDHLRHCIYKKLPGCAPVYYVYDKAGNCILTQDGELRQRGVWAYSIPDKFGRPCISGVCYNNISYTAEPLHSLHVYAEYDGASSLTGGYSVHNLTLASQTLFTATYYDNYAFIGQHGVPSSLTASTVSGFSVDASIGRGMQTGSAVAVLNDGKVTKYMYSALYYNSRYNVSQVKTMNHFGGTETTCTSYSYTDKPLNVKIQHTSTKTGSLVESCAYTYDDADRLSSRTLSITNGIQPLSITFGYEYDALGRLSKVTRPLTSANPNITYTYDLHGWLTGITTDSFREELFYADGPGTPSYNGNISSMRWKNNDYSSKRGYKFTYDDANRLTQASYGEGDAITSFSKFREDVQYDAHGNITRIIRNGKCSANSYGQMDNLTLSYDGNQLTGVSETATDYDFAGSFEYKKSKGSQYIYNNNGSLVADKSRGIAYITYDFNNNPQTIYFTNGYMTKYTYSALGDKLSVEHFIAQPNVTWAFGVQPDVSQSQPIFAGHTDYLIGGSLIVKEDIIKRLFFDGGYVDATALSSPTTYGFTPYYYNKDHLGNNREVVNRSNNVQQLTNYYPFGAPYADPTAVIGSTIQPYKYNGKELDTMHGLNTYDYGARQYYSIIGRWDRMDPLCEKYYDVSPYVYCENNPVNAIDSDGRSTDWYKDKDETYQYSPGVHSQKDLSKGQLYIGKSFTRGEDDNFVQYRSDGSILYNNETAAYNRMWNQADVHYRQMGERGGREVGGFILESGKVLVLPDYKNNINTSRISDYGYDISKNGDLIKGKEKFRVLANIHTHQKGAGEPTPSFYGVSDAKISEKMGARPVFTMGHDGRVYGIISNQSKYAPFSVPNPYGTLNKLLKGQQKFSTYIKNNKWSIEK